MSPVELRPIRGRELGRTRKIKYHEFKMCVWLIIPDGDAVIMRSTNRLAQDKGLDFNPTEGPYHA